MKVCPLATTHKSSSSTSIFHLRTLIRRKVHGGFDPAVDVREPLVASARAAGLDRPLAFKADSARSLVFFVRHGPWLFLFLFPGQLKKNALSKGLHNVTSTSHRV